MKNWTIYDSGITVLEGFDPAVLPRQAQPFLTTYVRKNERGVEGVSIEVGPYVGAIPLLDGSTLYLTPRIGYSSLARMLSVTERLDESVAKEFQQFAEIGFDAEDYSTQWVSLLARSFAGQLRLIEKNSMRSNREWKKSHGHTIKGRIDFLSTVTRLNQNKESPVVSSRKEKIYTTTENRILAAAAQTVLNLNIAEKGEREVFARWAGVLQMNPIKDSEIEILNRNISAGHYAGSRAYYIDALIMAKLLLLQGSLSIEGVNKVRSEALLTNIYLLYETYLRIILRKHLTDDGLLIEKLESGTPTLFIDGTAELHPDIIISRGTEVTLLIDAKYKLDNKISNADYFQMKAYMDAFSVRQGVIVRPSSPGQGNDLLSRKLNTGSIIHEIKLDLENWNSAEQFFVQTIKNLVS